LRRRCNFCIGLITIFKGFAGFIFDLKDFEPRIIKNPLR